ncbi:MAG: VacB/RNase II family 3'-5' exoribonuclease [Algisphaera sp.]
MPKKQASRILDHVAGRHYQPSTLDDLIEAMGIPKDQVEAFTEAVDHLLDEGHVVAGTADTIALPPPGKTMTGTLRRHEKGFGFLQPDNPTEHGDLFIPPGSLRDAMTGDRVVAKVIHEQRRSGGGSGKSPYVGKITEVLSRAEKAYAGTLIQKGKKFGVIVDGRMFTTPVLIRDIESKNAKVGDKVVLDLVAYPDDRGADAEGVITEVLGEAGLPDIETLAVMRAFGLDESFPDDVMDQARKAAATLTDEIPDDREDLTGELICTIDPPSAKDYDDAISLTKIEKGDEAFADYPKSAVWELGIHIADVAAYVEPGSPLDEEAYRRGNSTYLPRKVIPMLPEVLSNGVCSLLEGVNRYSKSAFLVFDKKGKVLSQRFARSVIRSAKRLTYLEAQALIDDDVNEAKKHAKEEPNYSAQVIQALKHMNELAKVIRKRRFAEGMIVLGLPSVELIFDDTGRVIDAEPEDDAFTHTIIEMFMVEANEAAARAFNNIDVPMIRRCHPDPDQNATGSLKTFARVAGYNIAEKPSRKELQELLEAVRGKPQQFAVHMAVLKTLSKAEYSPMLTGHFALASEHYTHFTSPIRRYPDFIVHRSLNAIIDAQAKLSAGKKRKPTKKAIAKAVEADDRVPSEDELRIIGQHCSTTERNSEQAERGLRQYLVLELMGEKLGEDFEATVTGITGQGVFMQIDRYLVDGFIHVNDLPSGGNDDNKKSKSKGKDSGDRWMLNRQTGALVAQRSGKVINIGDRFIVRVSSVDLAKRQLELAIIKTVHAVVESVPPEERGGHDRSRNRGGRDDKKGSKSGREDHRERGGQGQKRSAKPTSKPTKNSDTEANPQKKKQRGGRGEQNANTDSNTQSNTNNKPSAKKTYHKGRSPKGNTVIQKRGHRGKNKRK